MDGADFNGLPEAANAGKSPQTGDYLWKKLCKPQLITRRSLGVDKTTDAIQQSVHKYCVRVATNSSLSRRFNHKSAETRTGQGFCNVPPVRVFCFGLPNECFDGLICSFQKKRRTARTSDPPLRLRVILCASVRSITTNND